MNYYNYAHTGHRIGLDRFRRSATIIRNLQKDVEDFDILMLCSDFRIAQEARHHNIKRAVGVDVVRNIPQIAQNGDKIIFDSAEINDSIHQDMIGYFSTFVRISDDPEDQKKEGEYLISPYLEGEGICQAYIIDEKYFQEYEKKYDISLFFGDDDYEKDLLKNVDTFKHLNANLLLGYYFFLDYEAELSPSFRECFESEEMYDEIVTQSNILISASPQAVLEALASKTKVIYLQREDYPRDYIKLFEELNIPIVYNYDVQKIDEILINIESHKYNKVVNSTQKVNNFIKKAFDL